MQMSPSLKDFMHNLDIGPHGLEDAFAVIDKCAADRADTLDLQQMHLSDDHLCEILPRLPALASHVTTLNLFMNEITELPSQLSSLSSLTVLHAGCNPLVSISADLLSNLPALVELDVGFSETLTALPDAFHALSNLHLLDCGNNRLQSLPPSLYHCSKLSILNVYGNALTTLDDAISNLSSLRSLNVGRNQLSHIPSSLGKCSLLSTLHIYENSISSLPPSIANLPNLSTLTLHANHSLPVPPRDVRCTSGVKAIASYYASVQH